MAWAIRRTFGPLTGPIPTSYLDDNFGQFTGSVANSIAELRTRLIANSGGGAVVPLGYYTPADGGGGQPFYPNAADTTSGCFFTGSVSPGPAAPAAPTLTQVASGTQGARTEFFKITYVTAAGETLASAEASLTISANNVAVVASPVAVTGATGYNVYASLTSGNESKQNAQPIAIGTNYQEAAGGLLSGAVLAPTVNTAGSILTVSSVTNGTVVTNHRLSDVGGLAVVNSYVAAQISGTGGAGTYLLTNSGQTIASSTMVTDNGGTVLVGFDGGRWNSTFPLWFNPSAFGGDRTGVVDATSVLSAAANAMPSGGLLELAGLYKKGSTTYAPAHGVVNHHDYGTVGTNNIFSNSTLSGNPATGWTLANFTSLNPGVQHAAGTVGTLTQNAAISPFTMYLLSVTLTTTTQGGIAFSVNGVNVFDNNSYSIIPTGTNVVYQFAWLSSTDIAGEAVQLFTDTAWAGTVTNFSFTQIQQESQLDYVVVPTDDKNFNIPQGIKVGRFNAGNFAAGDRQTSALGGSAAVWNIAIGARSLSTNVSGLENTAVGNFTLQYNQSPRLAAFGYSALKYNTSGIQNTGLGYKALFTNSTGSSNTAGGFWASLSNTTGSFSTTLGVQAGYLNATGNYVTAIGYQSGLNSDAGVENTFVGALAGQLNTSTAFTYNYNFTSSFGAESKCYGSNTTALGFQARCGSDPNAAGTAIATSALAVGYMAVANADESVVIGPSSTISATTSLRTTVVGKGATGGGQNAVNVGFLSSTTDFSVAIGSQTGVNLTGTQNTSVGYAAGNLGAASAFNNTTNLGNGAVPTGSNQVTLGNASVTTLRCQVTTITALSDARDKTSIKPLLYGLDFVMKLRPVEWVWNARDGGRVGDRDCGFIAQDLLEAQGDSDCLNLVLAANPERLEASPGRMLPVLVKAIQELQAEIAELKRGKL